MIELRVTLEGEQRPIRALTRLAVMVEDVSPAWPDVVRKLREQAARLFTTQGASGATGAWEALTPRYAAWKERNYPGRTILELTGRLRAALQVETSDTVVEAESRFLFYGAEIPYGSYHMTGTTRMVARPPIAPTDRDAAEWVVEIKRYFERELSQYARAA